PQDFHAIMDRVFEVVLNAVHHYECTVTQFLGDGVMALFGAPIAHEDHAQRALSAALAIHDGLKPLAEDIKRAHGVEFRMRMGINTGPVVVGAIAATFGWTTPRSGTPPISRPGCSRSPNLAKSSRPGEPDSFATSSLC